MDRGRARHADETPDPSTVSLLFNPLLTTLLAYVLDRPLLELYMHGPALMGWGFHEGKEHALICAEYTGIPEMHWREAVEECEILIMRKFNALLVSLHFALYLAIVCTVVWSICGCAVFYCCCRPARSKPAAHLCYRCAFKRSCSNLLLDDLKPHKPVQ